jgi:hypothetical protein
MLPREGHGLFVLNLALPCEILVVAYQYFHNLCSSIHDAKFFKPEFNSRRLFYIGSVKRLGVSDVKHKDHDGFAMPYRVVHPHQELSFWHVLELNFDHGFAGYTRELSIADSCHILILLLSTQECLKKRGLAHSIISTREDS